VSYAIEAAARLAKLTEQRVRYLIRVGRISAKRVDGKMVLPFSEVARLRQLGSARQRGRVNPAQLSLALAPEADVVVLPEPARSGAASKPVPDAMPGALSETVEGLRERAYALEATDLEAALALHREVAVATDQADDWANLLAVLHEHRRSAEALNVVKQAGSRFVDSAVVQFNCGVVLHDGKQYAAAAAAYEAALSLEADFIDAHRYLHECYEALGQQQLALRHASAFLRAEHGSSI